MVCLSINFDRENKFYFEGEKIGAKLELSVIESVSVSNILVYFVGEACLIGRDPETKSVQVKDKDIYFGYAVPVFVAGENEPSTFSNGSYPFRLEYQLPSSLPTSLESPQGYVRYSVSASAEVGGSTVKCVEYFTVVSKVDLSNIVSANLPLVMWKHENQCIFSLLCFRNRQIRVFVNVPKRGFVPGEVLTVNADVLNYNHLPIPWVKAAIVQILKYNFSKGEKRKRVVVEVTRGCVMPYNSQTWRSENLFIPAIPPTSMYDKKGLITVKYKFYFLIKTSWQEKAVTLKQKIIIGALPITECKQAEVRGQGEGDSVVSNYYCQYSSLEPCMFGPHSVGEENSTTSFSPLYPVYID